MTTGVLSLRIATACGAISLCLGLGGCSTVTTASRPAHPPTSTTSPSYEELWTVIGGSPGPFVGEVEPLGATASLEDDTDGLHQTATASVARIVDVAAPTGLAPSFGGTPSTLPGPAWRWVVVQLTVTNEGPQDLGSPDEYTPVLDVFVNGHLYRDLAGASGRYTAGGCRPFVYPPLAPHASASGCIALQVPAGARVASVGLGLHAAGAGVSPQDRAGALATWRGAPA